MSDKIVIRSLEDLAKIDHGRRMSLAEYGALLDGDIKDAEIEKLRAEVDRLTDELDATRAEMERLRAEHRAEIERLRADIERIEDEAWHDGAKHGTSH